MKSAAFVKRIITSALLIGGLFLGLTLTQPVQAQSPTPPALNGASACMAQETSYRQVFTAVKDTWIDETHPTVNYGASTLLYVSRDSLAPNYLGYTLVQFDVSSLPANAVIVSATLELYGGESMLNGPMAPAFYINPSAVISSWVETNVTWNTRPATTGAGAAVIYRANDWTKWDVAGIVQDWYDGSLENNGIELRPTIVSTGSRVFAARTTGHTPRLVVKYRLQTELTLWADTVVDQASPENNYGSYAELYMGRREIAPYAEAHALFRFDTSGIPANSAIVSAALGVYPIFNQLNAPTAPMAAAFSPEAILAGWDEAGVTWNNRPGSANQGDPTVVWNGGVWTWWDVTQIVDRWHSGALIDYGILLRPTNAEMAGFVGRPGGGQARLIVTYGPLPCYAATSVTIGGATRGITGAAYTFAAALTPVTATAPITYTWEAAGQTPHSGPQEEIEYTWTTPGWKTITVTVENCDSSIVNTRQISITAPTPTCPAPITGLSLSGPAQGVTATQYAFTASLVPAHPTQPYTLTWEADGQTPVSSQQTTVTFTWTTPGIKQIVASAENCDGAAAHYHSINILPTSQLPDLQISSIWYNPEESRIYYIVKNMGGSASPSGYIINFTQAITPVVQSVFTEVLQPGWARAGAFDYEWGCNDYPPGTSALRATVCADSAGVVPEGDEGNNCYETWWACDVTTPGFGVGPTIVATTEHTATVAWTTDEPCRASFAYGKSGPFGITTIPDDDYRINHQVELTGLDNASTYWYKVSIADAAGLLNNSGGAFFETRPPGADPVNITGYNMSEYPSSLYEFYTLWATVADPEGVDNIAFFLDDVLIGRDYTPDASGAFQVYLSPAARGFDRALWFGAPHKLEVKAYNLEQEVTTDAGTVNPPDRPMPGAALLVSPAPDKQMTIDGETAPAGTSITMGGYGAQYEWKCTDSGFAEGAAVPPGAAAVDCDDIRDLPYMLRFYLDGVPLEQHMPDPGEFSYSSVINLTGQPVGEHTLRFTVEVDDSSVYTSEKKFRIVQGRGNLEFDRTATRNGNAIQVTLTIRNTGAGTAYVDYVEDYARGFQVIETGNALGRLSPAANYYAVKNNDYGDTPDRTIMIDLFGDGSATEITLAPGASLAIPYQLAPILYPQWETYYIGSGDAGGQVSRAHYRYEGVPGAFTENIEEDGNWIGGVAINTVVQNIAAASDYILVTSPAGLVAYSAPVNWRSCLGTARELGLLLSRMAELATLRNGVLGYLPTGACATTLDALLEPGGLWANALHPNFRGYNATGYVLFVGEDEIIPPQDAGYDAPYSDLRYASTSGQAKPELVLGRIAGDDMGTLRRGLESAIDFARDGDGFDRQRALLNSGRAEGEGEFWTQINEIDDRLNFANVTRLRWKNYPTRAEIVAAFQAEMALGQSLVAYRGHGGASQWGYDNTAALYASEISTLNFNGYHPFVWGLACSTADYHNSYSMPEAWLRYGAGGYVGSVNVAYTDRNGNATRAFFNRWGNDSTLSVGYSLVDMERDHWSDSYDWKAWIYQHHLFGDPKFGALPTRNVTTARALAPNGPTGPISIVVPDYVVNTDEDGIDHVTIPDGGSWISPTDYSVPTWKVAYTYPAGWRVQGVTLTAQSGLTVATGLQLPVATTMMDGAGNTGEMARIQASAAISGWYPQFEQDFTWTVSENPDGTSTFELILYPFTYNPETTDVRFYKNWDFNVEILVTGANIVKLQTVRPTYRLTETVTANLVVNNGGAAQDLIVQALIKSAADETTVAALPLQTLHAITGAATLDLEAPTLAAGDYTLVVTVSDMNGRTLDTERVGFIKGIAASAVTDLIAAPAQFRLGDTVALSLTFQNSGDLALDGVATLRVTTGEGITQTAEFTQTFTAFTPGASIAFNANWDTAGAPNAATYRVVGYVQSGNFTSIPQEITLSIRESNNVYLPLILR